MLSTDCKMECDRQAENNLEVRQALKSLERKDGEQNVK